MLWFPTWAPACLLVKLVTARVARFPAWQQNPTRHGDAGNKNKTRLNIASDGFDRLPFVNSYLFRTVQLKIPRSAPAAIAPLDL